MRVHSGSHWGSMGSSGVVGFTAIALGVVGFTGIRPGVRWVHSVGALGSFGVVRFTRDRPLCRCVHAG